LKRVATTYRVN
jgi:hypothetical protein